MAKAVLKDECWKFMNSEIAHYILEYSSLDTIYTYDADGNAVMTEEKQDQFSNISDTVEEIMRTVLIKESEVNDEWNKSL